MIRLSLTLLAALLLGAVLAAPATAQQPRDLQALIDATGPGATLELTPGTYEGGVTIERPITIKGLDWPVVDAGANGSVFTVNSPDVAIEGLVITNTGISLDREDAGISSDGSPRLIVKGNRFEDVLFGVFLRTSPNAQVVDNIVGAKQLEPGRRGDGIRLWESPDSLVQGNTIVGGRDTVLWFSNGVKVLDNYVADGRYGLHFMYSDGAVVEGNRLERNSVGLFLMYSRDLVLRNNVMAENNGPSGYGVGLKDMDGVVATGNRFIGNRAGLYLDNSPWSYDGHQTFENNVFAYNDVGVLFQPSVKRNHFTGNAFIDNGEQVGVTGTGTFSGNAWTVDGVGNYWSDFAGYDADGDGVGDVSYLLDDLYSELTDTHPTLQFFAETPASRAVDVAARMFPVFRPRPKVEDTAPLVRMPVMPAVVPGGSVRSPLPTAATSLLLLAAAVALVLTARGGRREVSL
jgi:nitrous oxidase accessory protein